MPLLLLLVHVGLFLVRASWIMFLVRVEHFVFALPGLLGATAVSILVYTYIKTSYVAVDLLLYNFVHGDMNSSKPLSELSFKY